MNIKHELSRFILNVYFGIVVPKEKEDQLSENCFIIKYLATFLFFVFFVFNLHEFSMYKINK